MSIKPALLANTVISGVVGYDLKHTIDIAFVDSNDSPIDNFINNGIEINRLFVNTDPPRILGNLIILGYISAVESYYRDVIRRIILIDSISKKSNEKKPITYGAVMLNERHMLPEALFDDKSLAGKKEIINSLNNFLGLSIQEHVIPADLKETLNMFNEICELRHCIVHRFGKFGSKNAIALGLSGFDSHIEKPISCSYSTLQNIITVCQNIVRIMNNYLYGIIMERLLIVDKKEQTNSWSWSYEDDKEVFNNYFSVFHSRIEPFMPTSTNIVQYDYEEHMKASYNEYKTLSDIYK